MAVTSGTVHTGTYSKSYFYVNWQQTGQSIANNTTTISYQVGLYTGTSSSHDLWGNNAVRIDSLSINGQSISGGTYSNITTGGNHDLKTGTITIPHNADGTKSFSISITGWLYSNHTLTGSGNFELTPIPRYTSITTFRVEKRNETSFTVTWGASDPCDKAWYSINNGSSWIEANGYPNFIISNLSPNTTYKCKLRVRRTDSKLTTDSNTMSQTTYKVPTQSLKDKTETSISMNWSADSTISKVEYSTNGGNSYTTATNNANATSGSYTISGLTANRTYNIVTRLTRTSVNTNYPSAALSVATYQYPYVSAIGTSNLLIGGTQTLTIYNPKSRIVNVYMKQNNTSGTLLYSGTTSGTSITFTPNANTLLSSIPNNTSGSAIYYCTYSNQNVSNIKGTYSINNTDGSYNPTFNLNDWSYVTNLTELTNNNQIIIANQSKITVTINNEATPQGNATIKRYNLVWGSAKSEITSNSGDVEKGNGILLIVQAEDSRGYTTTTQLDITDNYIEYFNPTSSSSSADRNDGIEADTTLNLRGTLFYNTFGTDGVQNTIESAKYYVSIDNEEWSDGYDIDVSKFTYSSNYYTLSNYNIYADGNSGGFSVGTRYYIKIDITDKLTTYSFGNIQITDGKIGEDTYQDENHEYHRGINGLAVRDHTLRVYGGIGLDDSLKVYNGLGGSFSLDQATTSNDVFYTTPTHSGFIETRTILYNNLSGTTGTVTLSEDASNFDFLRVYYTIKMGTNVSINSSEDVSISSFVISNSIYNDVTNYKGWYILTEAINISNNTLNRSTYLVAYDTYLSSVFDFDDTNKYIYITRVEGIKLG